MKYKKSTLREKAAAEIKGRRLQYEIRLNDERGTAQIQFDAALRNQQEQLERMRKATSVLADYTSREELVPRRQIEDMTSSRRGWSFDLLETEATIAGIQRSLTAERVLGSGTVPVSTPEGRRIRALEELIDLLDMVEDDTISTHALEQAGWKHSIPR